jgi:hypothetical protein
MNHRMIVILNVGLGLISCLLALKVYGVWNRDLSLMVGSADRKATTPSAAEFEQYTRAVSPKKSYEIIVTKNLFSSSRTEGEKRASLRAESEIKLRGTLVWGKHKAALIEMPDLKGPNTLKDVKIGDTVAGYRVANILDDKVVLKSEREGKCCILNLQRQKQKEKHIRTDVPKGSGKKSKKSFRSHTSRR